MEEEDVILLTTDESDVDDSAPIVELLNKHQTNHTKEPMRADSDSGNIAAFDMNKDSKRIQAVRRDFLSDSDDDDLPDVQVKDVEIKSTSPHLQQSSSLEHFKNDSSQNTELTNSSQGSGIISDAVELQKKVRKKRTPTEIDEQHKLAQEKKQQKADERRKKKQETADKKQQAQRDRKIQSDLRKQNTASDCQKFITVVLDSNIVRNGYGSSCIELMSGSDSRCITQDLTVPNSIQWVRNVQELSQSEEESPMELIQSEVLEKDIMLVLSATDFTQLVHFQLQAKKGNCTADQGFTDHIKSIKCRLPRCSVTVVVIGMDKYYRQQKTIEQRQHRQGALLVQGEVTDVQTKKRKKETNVNVSRIEIEEVMVDAQLQTDCNIKTLDSATQLAELVKSFTKAIAEAPIKKDRLESAFSFHCEPLTGVKVTKNGEGLLKVWKNQIRQFRAVSADMADAIIEAYPSPRLLLDAYERCQSAKEAEKLLENIQVRRGAGLLETNRRIGKELSLRIHQFMTSCDPNVVIK